MSMMWVKGQLTEADNLPLLNRSFKYGDGLFESIRIYRGKLLFVGRHLQRLRQGMDLLGISYDTEWLKSLEEGLYRAVAKQQIHGHGRLRLHVLRGGEGAYRPLDDTPLVVLEAFSLKHDPMQEPPAIGVTIFSDIPLYETPLSSCKTANALPYVLAARFAQQKGYDEALLLHQSGVVAEASSANLFFVQNQKLYTPPLNTGCLDGVMRQVVMQVAAEVKIPVQEKRIRPKELRQVEEVFLTNAIRGIVPVNALDGHAFPRTGRPITSFLQNCLQQYIHRGV